MADGQRKAGPGREPAAIAGAHQADGKSDLAAGGSRQELAQTHEIGIGLLVDPMAAYDELVAEIPDMSDRSAKAGDAELEEDEQNFEGEPARWSVSAECAAIVITGLMRIARVP